MCEQPQKESEGLRTVVSFGVGGSKQKTSEISGVCTAAALDL